MHLRDVLNMGVTDFELERSRIEKLFQEETFIVGYNYHTLKTFAETAFRRSKLRGTALSLSDFLQQCSAEWEEPSLSALLFYCEVILNLVRLVLGSGYVTNEARSICGMIAQNIDLILNRTGYYYKVDDDEIITIYQKDALASAVVEDLSEKDVASAVLAYNRLESKGDVEGKSKLLFTIGKYTEPVYQQYKSFVGLKRDVAENVRFGLNNLHVRHNNEEGKDAKPILARMTDEELEEAYDDLYRSMLLLIELDKYPETDKRIKALRAKV